MTTSSGWCMGPAGARIHHENCRSKVCSCACHLDADRLILSRKLVESGTESGPESASTDRGLATVSTTPKGA